MKGQKMAIFYKVLGNWPFHKENEETSFCKALYGCFVVCTQRILDKIANPFHNRIKMSERISTTHDFKLIGNVFQLLFKALSDQCF